MEQQNSRKSIFRSLFTGGLIGAGSVIAMSIVAPVAFVASVTLAIITTLVSSLFVSAGISAIAGAAAGLVTSGMAGAGLYKAAKATCRKVKNSPSLSRKWTAAGAAAGVIGMMSLPGPPVYIHYDDIENLNDAVRNKKIYVMDLGREFGKAGPLQKVVALEVAESEAARYERCQLPPLEMEL